MQENGRQTGRSLVRIALLTGPTNIITEVKWNQQVEITLLLFSSDKTLISLNTRNIDILIEN